MRTNNLITAKRYHGCYDTNINGTTYRVSRGVGYCYGFWIVSKPHSLDSNYFEVVENGGSFKTKRDAMRFVATLDGTEKTLSK